MKKPKVVRFLATGAIAGGTLIGLSAGLVACSTGSSKAEPSSNNSGSTAANALSSIATSLDNVFKSKAPDGKQLDGYSMSLYQGRFYNAILPYLIFANNPQSPLQVYATVGRQQVNEAIFKAFGLDVQQATGEDLNSANNQLRAYLAPLQNMITRIAAPITSNAMTLNAYFENTDTYNSVLKVTITQGTSLTYRALQVAQTVMSYFGMNPNGQVNPALTNFGVRQQLGLFTDEIIQKDYYQWDVGAKKTADAVFDQVVSSQLAGFSKWSEVQYDQDITKATDGTIVTGFVTARFVGSELYAEPAYDNNYRNGVLTYSTRFLVHSTVATNPTEPANPNGQPNNPLRPSDQKSVIVKPVNNTDQTYVNSRTFPVDLIDPPKIAVSGYVIPANYEWQDENGKELSVDDFLRLADKTPFYAVWTISPLPNTNGLPYTYSQQFLVVRTSLTAPVDTVALDEILVDNEARKTLPSDLLTAPAAAEGYIVNGPYVWVDANGNILTQAAYVALQDGQTFSAVWTFVRADGKPGSYKHTQLLRIALAPLQAPSDQRSPSVSSVDNTVRTSLPNSLLAAPTPIAGYAIASGPVWKDANGDPLTEQAYKNLADRASFGAVWTMSRTSGRPLSYTYTQRFIVALPPIAVPADQTSPEQTAVDNTGAIAFPDQLLTNPSPAEGYKLGTFSWQDQSGNPLSVSAYAALADQSAFSAVWTFVRSDNRPASYKYVQRFVIDQSRIVIPPSSTSEQITPVNNLERSALPADLLQPPAAVEGFELNGSYKWVDSGGGLLNDAKFVYLPNGIFFTAVWTFTRIDKKSGTYTYAQKFLIVRSALQPPADQTSDSVIEVDNTALSSLPVSKLTSPPAVTGYVPASSVWVDQNDNPLDDFSFAKLANGASFSAVWTLNRSDGKTGTYKYRQRFVIYQAPKQAPASQTSPAVTEVDNTDSAALPIGKIVAPAALYGYYPVGPYVWQGPDGTALTDASFARLSDGASFNAVWTFVRIDGKPGTYTYTQRFVIKQPVVSVPEENPGTVSPPVSNVSLIQQVANLLAGKTADGTKPLDGYTLSLLKGNFFVSALPHFQLGEELSITLNKASVLDILTKTTRLAVNTLTDDELLTLKPQLNELLQTLAPILGALSVAGAPDARISLNVSKNKEGIAQATIGLDNVPADKKDGVRSLLKSVLGTDNPDLNSFHALIQKNLGLLTDATMETVVPFDDKIKDFIQSALISVKNIRLAGFSDWSEVTYDNDPDLASFGDVIVGKIVANYTGGNSYAAIPNDARYAGGRLVYSVKFYVGAKQVADNTALINKIKNELSHKTADGILDRDGYTLSVRAANVVLDWLSSARYDAAGGYLLNKSAIQKIIRSATGIDATELTDGELLQVGAELVAYLGFIKDRVKSLAEGSFEMTMALEQNAARSAQLSGVVFSASQPSRLAEVIAALSADANAPAYAIQAAYGKLSADPLVVRVKTGADQKQRTDEVFAAIKSKQLAGFSDWSDVTYSSDPAQATNNDQITGTITADYLDLANFATPELGGRLIDWQVRYVVTFVYYVSDTAAPQDNAKTVADLRGFFTGTDPVTSKPLNGYVTSLNNGNVFAALLAFFNLDDSGRFTVSRADLNNQIRRASGIDPSLLTEDEMVSLSSSLEGMMKPLRDLLPTAGAALGVNIDFTLELAKGSDGKAGLRAALKVDDPTKLATVVGAVKALIGDTTKASEADNSKKVQQLLGLMTDLEFSDRIIANSSINDAAKNSLKPVLDRPLAGYGPWSPISYSKSLSSAQPGDVVVASSTAEYVGADKYAPFVVSGRVKEGGRLVYTVKLIITDESGSTTAPVDHKQLIDQLRRGIVGQDPFSGLSWDGYTKSLHRGRFELLWVQNFKIGADSTYTMDKPLLIKMLKALTGLDASPLTDAEIVSLNPAYAVMIGDKLATVAREAAAATSLVQISLSSQIRLNAVGEAVIAGALFASNYLDIAIVQANTRTSDDASKPSQSTQVTYGFMTDDTLVYLAPVGAAKSALDVVFSAIASKQLARFGSWSAPSYSANLSTTQDGDVVIGKIVAPYLGADPAYEKLQADYRIEGNNLVYSIAFKISKNVSQVTGANTSREVLAYVNNFLTDKNVYTGIPLDGYRASLTKGEFIKALLPLMHWSEDGTFTVSKDALTTLFAGLSKVNLGAVSEQDFLGFSSAFARFLSPLVNVSTLVATAINTTANLSFAIVRNDITGVPELQGRLALTDTTKMELAINTINLSLGSANDLPAVHDTKIQLNLGLYTSGTIEIEVSKDNLNESYVQGLVGGLMVGQLSGFSAWSSLNFSKPLASAAIDSVLQVYATATYQGEETFGKLPAGGRINNGVLTYTVNLKVVQDAASVGGISQVIIGQLLNFFTDKNPTTGLKVNGYVKSSRMGLVLNEWINTVELDANGTFALNRSQLNQMFLRVTGIDVSPLRDGELVSLNAQFKSFFSVIAEFITASSKGKVSLALELLMSSRGTAMLSGALNGTPDDLSVIADEKLKAAGDPAPAIQVLAGYFSPQILSVKVNYTDQVQVLKSAADAAFRSIIARPLDRFLPWSAISYSKDLASLKPGDRFEGFMTSEYRGNDSAYQEGVAYGYFDGQKIVYRVYFTVVGASDTTATTSNDIWNRISNVFKGLDPVTGKQLDGYTDSLHSGAMLKYLMDVLTVSGDATITLDKNTLLNMIRIGTEIDASSLSDDQLVQLTSSLQYFVTPLVNYVRNQKVVGITPTIAVRIEKNSLGLAQLFGWVTTDSSLANSVIGAIAGIASNILANFRADPDRNIQETLGIMTPGTATFHEAPGSLFSIDEKVAAIFKQVSSKRLRGFGAWSGWKLRGNTPPEAKQGDILVYEMTAPFLNDPDIQQYTPSGRLKLGQVVYTVNVIIGVVSNEQDGQFSVYKAMLGVFNGIDPVTGKKTDGYTRAVLEGSIRSWLLSNFLATLSRNTFRALIVKNAMFWIEYDQLKSLLSVATGYSATTLSLNEVRDLVPKVGPYIRSFLQWIVDSLDYVNAVKIAAYDAFLAVPIDEDDPGYFTGRRVGYDILGNYIGTSKNDDIRLYGDPDASSLLISKPNTVSIAGYFKNNFLYVATYDAVGEVTRLLGRYRNEKLGNYVYNELGMMSRSNLQLYISKPKTMDAIRKPIVQSLARIQSVTLKGFTPWSDLVIKLPSGKTFREVVKGDKITGTITAQWANNADLTYVRPADSDRFRNDKLTFTVEVYVV